MFIMEAHLPHVLVKQHPKLREDSRIRADRTTRIRTGTDLSFMSVETPGELDTSDVIRDCLYPNQFSLIMTGFNKHIHTTYCLTDTYHSSYQDPDDLPDGSGAVLAVGTA